MTESDVPGDPPPEGVAFAAPEPEPAQPTAPVPGRPAVRPRRAGPVTRMGPWAPVAGALLGGVLGLVAVLVLAGTADAFAERLALVLLVVGGGRRGAAGPRRAGGGRRGRRGV